MKTTTGSIHHQNAPDKPQDDRTPPFVRLQWAVFHTLRNTPPGELDTTGRAVMMAVAMHLNDRGEAQLAQGTIAAIVGKSDRTLRRILADLQRDGWLLVTPGNGAGRMSTYTVAPRAIAAQKVDIALSTFANGTSTEKVVISGEKVVIFDKKVDTAPEKSVDEPYNPITLKGVKGENPNGGGVGNAATKHDAAPAIDAAKLPEELRAAWLAAFGELTDKQTGFMRNAIKEHGAGALASAISAAHEYRHTTGKTIAKPAGFVGRKLQRAAGTPGDVAPDYGFLAKNAPRPAQAGDTGADWEGIAQATGAHRAPIQAPETAPAGASVPTHGTTPQNGAQAPQAAPAGTPGKPARAHSIDDMWRALVAQETAGQVGRFVDWLQACRPAPQPLAAGVLQVVMPSSEFAAWVQNKYAAGIGRKVRVATHGAIDGVRFIDARHAGHD